VTIAVRATATTGVQTDPTRKAALATGILFIITFLTSIPALLLFGPVLNDPGYIVSAGADNGVLLGAFLELLLIIANIATAIVLFPVLKRQHEAGALGYVTARIVECTFIAVGIVSVLAVVTLQQDFAGAGGAEADALVTVGAALVAVKNWTFDLGPGFVVGIGNGLLLGYLMYRSGLLPRPVAVLGMIAGTLVCASGIATLFGVIDPDSVWKYIAAIPEMIWEAGVLGLWLIVKGFNASPVTSASALTEATPGMAAHAA
jgi:hypothetical protein